MPDRTVITDQDKNGGKEIKLSEDEWPIDEGVWFKISRTWVSGAEARIEKQVTSIHSAIQWFFGLGSSAVIIGVLLKDPIIDFWSGISFAITVFCLFVSYACATSAITLISRKIEEANSWEAIKKTFNESNNASRQRLIISTIFMFLGFGLFCFSIIIILASKERARAVPIAGKADFKAQARISKKDTTVFITDIDISGTTPDSTSLKLRLENGDNLLSTATVCSLTHVLHRKEFDMNFHLDIPVPLKKNRYFLTMIYSSGFDSMQTKTIELLIPKG